MISIAANKLSSSFFGFAYYFPLSFLIVLTAVLYPFFKICAPVITVVPITSIAVKGSLENFWPSNLILIKA